MGGGREIKCLGAQVSGREGNFFHVSVLLFTFLSPLICVVPPGPPSDITIRVTDTTAIVRWKTPITVGEFYSEYIFTHEK